MRARVDFSSGLSVFSGETGSGKTMLLGALRFALGERAGTDMVRAGAARARVTLEIEPDEAFRARLLEDGFDFDAGEDAIFARDLQAARANRARASTGGRRQARNCGPTRNRWSTWSGSTNSNGCSRRRIRPRFSIALPALPRWWNANAVAAAHARAANSTPHCAKRTTSARGALAEAEFARFAAAEIEAATLAEGEDDPLRERRAYLSNVERMADALRDARAALAGDEGGASDAVGDAAASALAQVAQYGAALEALAARLHALQDEAREAAAALARELELTDFDPAEAETTGARLDAIESLKRKYGGTVAAVLEAGEPSPRRWSAYDARDTRSAELRKKSSTAARRARTARSCRSAHCAQRPRLHARAACRRRVERRSGCRARASPSRWRRCPRSVRAARSASSSCSAAESRRTVARPLARAASGGELSRVLLALVVVLADRRDPTTLVFDEVDAGIGGATAAAVGVRLGDLARGVQVLAVTHLAQIASWADTHVVLRKRDVRGGTRIDALTLDGDDVTAEIARMLSGSAEGVAREHAGA